MGGTAPGTQSDKTPRGRKGADKQEQVERPQIVDERIDELVRLKTKADEASEDFSNAIKKTAEDSGLLASVVRRFVVARAGENFQEKKRECTQLALLFDEVGE
jgi:hypothetical protein